MKQRILFLGLVLILLAGCSAKKDGLTHRMSQKFFSYYNTLFNAKEALNYEIENRKTSYQEDYYSPYIHIFPYEISPESHLSKKENNEIQKRKNTLGEEDEMPDTDVASGSLKATGLSPLDIAEAKALKVIDKHKMLFGGEEKNPYILDANIILARARLYKGDYMGVLEATNYITTHMKTHRDYNLGRIYEAYTLARMRNYYKAEEIFRELQEDARMNRQQKEIYHIYYAQLLNETKRPAKAVEELEKAYGVARNRNVRSRIAFQRGQLLTNLGQMEEARASFAMAFKEANNFEFEVKSQIAIARTYTGKDGEYEPAKKYLLDLAQRGTYQDRQSEFFFAIGLLANQSGKKDEAQDFFRRAVRAKQSDPQITGLAYYEIGKSFFNQQDYLGASAYYDSAVARMTYVPTKKEVEELSKNLKSISANYFLIKKNDSILKVASLPKQEQREYYAQYISNLQEKERIAEQKALQEKRKQDENAFLDTYRSFNTSTLGMETETSGSTQVGNNYQNASDGFYFSNQSTIARGESEFRRIWGNRTLSDNWRYSRKNKSLNDKKNELLGAGNTANPRRFEPDFYIERLPKDSTILAQIKYERDTASLGLGRMYYNLLGNKALGTQTLYNLVDTNPDDKTMQQALFQIFSWNYQGDASVAQRAKEMLIKNYPESKYAAFVMNPGLDSSNGSATQSTDVEKKYQEAYGLYTLGKYKETIALIDQVTKENQKDVLGSKLFLLKAFALGKTGKHNEMNQTLDHILLQYEGTQEASYVQKMVSNLRQNDPEESSNEGTIRMLDDTTTVPQGKNISPDSPAIQPAKRPVAPQSTVQPNKQSSLLNNASPINNSQPLPRQKKAKVRALRPLSKF